MNEFSLINCGSAGVLFGSMSALCVAMSKKSVSVHSGIFLLICLVINFIVAVSNVLEHMNIYDLIDRYEEYFEILIIPFFLLFIYSLSSTNEIERRRKNEDRLSAALEERSILLKEIHHRVKNNMQTIASMLEIQASTIDDPQIAKPLRETVNRILAMGLVHKKLYQSEDFSSINLREYIESIISLLRDFYKDVIRDIDFSIDIGNHPVMDLDSAIPLGLIINELITNSIVHAFQNEKKGEIGISLKKIDDATIMFEVYDTGSGLPEQIDFDKNCGLGLQIVKILTLQLKGDISIVRSGGTLYRITLHYCGDEE
ncbi:sensor histidine kinase [bacterium]|nr:sensor histidine kinase [bacterium]